MASITRKPRSFKYTKKSHNTIKTERCPGCLGFPDNIRALAIYVHKSTGKAFSYSLCDKCATRLQVNAKAIITNVEAYFSAEIAKMDAEGATVAR